MTRILILGAQHAQVEALRRAVALNLPGLTLVIDEAPALPAPDVFALMEAAGFDEKAWDDLKSVRRAARGYGKSVFMDGLVRALTAPPPVPRHRDREGAQWKRERNQHVRR